MVFGFLQGLIFTMPSSQKSGSSQNKSQSKKQAKKAKKALDKMTSQQDSKESTLSELNDPALAQEREEFRKKYSGVVIPVNVCGEGEPKIVGGPSSQGLAGLFSREEEESLFDLESQGEGGPLGGGGTSGDATSDHSSGDENMADATSNKSFGSGGAARATAEMEATAVAQYENLMDNALSVTTNYAAYVQRLVVAGVNHPDPSVSDTWSAVEPTVAELLKRFPVKAGKVLVGMAPCTPGEFFNRAIGMHEGLTWHMGETLDQVQDELSNLVDSLKQKVHILEQREEAHHAQTLKFAEQASQASTSLALSVKSAEDTFLKMADFAMRLPVQVDSSSKATSGEVGHLRVRPPPKRREGARSPTSSVISSYSALNPPESASQQETQARRVVTNIDEDGVYAGEQIAVTVEKGRVTKVRVASNTLDAVKGLEKRKAALAQLVLARSPEELRKILREHPDWLTLANALSGREAKELLLQIFPPSRSIARWSWTPLGG